LQHGEALAGNIRSFYRRFLSAGIIPFLNSEQWQIASVLQEYQKPEYADGQFGYRLLLDSGKNLLQYIPEEHKREMEGIAQGCGLTYDDIVILNTFLDTLFGLRSIIFVLRTIDAPLFRNVVFESDEDGDGVWVVHNEINPYEPDPYALLVEVPTRVRLRFLFTDPQTVRKESIRLILGHESDEGVWEKRTYVFDPQSDIITATAMGTDDMDLEVIFTPPEELPPDSVVSVQISISDNDLVQGHGPDHYHVMRPDRFVFKTAGDEQKAPQELHEIPNKGARDERLQPVSIGFALRGSATTDGKLLAAHSFTGLDNDTAHKNAAVIIHKPDVGEPYVTVAIAGVVWGSSGMNSDGLTCMFNLSDTWDNPVTDQVLKNLLDAKLITSGTPIGFLLKQILESKSTVEEAEEVLRNAEHTYGWNVLLADATGSMSVVEIDPDVLDNAFNPGFFAYSPDDTLPWELDPWGRPWASEGPDDVYMAMHYRANSEDFNLLGILKPQRYWTTYYYRSLRTFYELGEEIAAVYEEGPVGPESVMRIMRNPELEDQRNSMNATMFSPQDLKLWYALGEVPATDAPFRPLDFGARIGKGVGP